MREILTYTGRMTNTQLGSSAVGKKITEFHCKVLQQNTWIDDRKFLKSCVRARAEQGNINHPAYGNGGKMAEM